MNFKEQRQAAAKAAARMDTKVSAPDPLAKQMKSALKPDYAGSKNSREESILSTQNGTLQPNTPNYRMSSSQQGSSKNQGKN